MAANIHVSISAEPVFNLGGFNLTNSLLTGTFISLFLITFCLYLSTLISKKKKISRLQSLVEMFIEGIYNLTKDIAGEKKAREFFPLIASAIIFILFNNWVSILPGVGTIGIVKTKPSTNQDHVLIPQAQAIEATESHQTAGTQETGEDEVHDTATNPDESSDLHTETTKDTHEEPGEHSAFVPLIRPATADLNTTLGLALISVVLTQFYGIQYLGLSYFSKFFNFKQGPIFTFVGLLELVSEFAKIISFAFRLFGNIFAGEVLLTVIAYLLPALAPLPFMGLELFVGFIQALVFGMLTLVFINMATIGHADDHS